MRLEGMNLDVQYLCFVNVHPQDLLSLSETNQHFSHLARDIFAREHSKKSTKFEIWNFDPEQTTQYEIVDSDTEIRFENYLTILRFLRNFGDLILDLRIVYTNPFNHRELQECLVAHCVNSLQQLHINILDKDGPNFKFADKITAPFAKVEELSISGIANELGSDTLSFT